jgi:hypothetical protein
MGEGAGLPAGVCFVCARRNGLESLFASSGTAGACHLAATGRGAEGRGLRCLRSDGQPLIEQQLQRSTPPTDAHHPPGPARLAAGRPPYRVRPPTLPYTPTMPMPEEGRDHCGHPPDCSKRLTCRQWGLIPHWTKHPPTAPLNPINARSESLLEAGAGGMWQALKGYKRCVIPAQG